jgi:hypothetical protein
VLIRRIQGLLIIIDKGERVREGEGMANPGKSGRGSPPLHAASEIAIKK